MTDERLERVERDMTRLTGALKQLASALAEPEASSKSWQDTAQAYEYAMDLFWKVAKEMLAVRGVEVHMPREALQHAHERGWVDDTSVWVEMLKDEYELSGSNHSHLIVQHLYPKIRGYYPEMCRVHEKMAERLAEFKGA